MILATWAGTGFVPAEVPRRLDAAEIQLALKKLRVLASVLYVGAHPDDENTRLIGYLGNGRLADTAYLSMTRGDGGQNLIGPEIGELLGIIRSQELLAARRIDGGRQFFTRARDFGFSKTPEETLRIWNKDQVLADTVRVFREFQPDVVITRFPTKAGGTHGHHTASALLAVEAFAAAGDATRFPEQLDRVQAWKPRRILWNTSSWFYSKEEWNPAGMLTLNTGEYSPLLGESFSEMAARSRSMHKSQGFGSSGTRGDVLEYLDLLGGEPAKKDLFENIDTTWGRLAGGKEVGERLDRAYREFQPENPSGVVPILLDARAKLAALPESRWKIVKLADLDRTIVACLGLYLEVGAESYTAVPGETVKLTLEAAARSPVKVTLERVTVPLAGTNRGETNRGEANRAETNQDTAKALNGGEAIKSTIEVKLPADLPDSQPYWLKEKGTTGMFRVDDPALIGSPENAPSLTAAIDLTVDGIPFSVRRPVVYEWTDPVRGELRRPFEVVPAVAVDLDESAYVFPDARAREVGVRVRAAKVGVDGDLRLEAPEGWKIAPPSRKFHLDAKDSETTLTFEVRPPTAASAGSLRAVAEAEGRRYHQGLVHIDYPHIPTQVCLPEAEAHVVRVDVKRKGQTLGYLQGAGDQVPAGLRQIGYTVAELKEEDLSLPGLKRFDAVILGVRACNTLERDRLHQPVLFDYVKAGGTLIVQYNTSNDLHVDSVAPFPLRISHDRVTEEEAEVRFLLPDHAALNLPNRITGADFTGWVQERGLYFADQWDAAFEAVLSSNDTGEPPRNGGLLVARYGEGYFVYTGYSFFRQIPAGVPGAYRLLANLIALGH